jgi:hypothetical protein
MSPLEKWVVSRGTDGSNPVPSTGESVANRFRDCRSRGDGVNVAARLEALAEPGGIRVSWVVRD